MIQIPVEPAISEFLHRKASLARIPLSGTFELTPVCNMDCKMCYVRMSSQQQRSIRPLRCAQEWLSLAQKAKDAGLLYLLLTGGEPFLHPEFRQIMEGLTKMGFLISINTNGTLIDEATVAWLKECAPMRINITLYGASNDTYGALCGNPNGFTQVTNAIRLLRDAGMTVKINCSLTPFNIHDLSPMVEYVKAQKLIMQTSTYMFPPLRKDPSMIGCNERFSPEDAAYYSAMAEFLINGKTWFLEQPEDEFVLPGELDESCSETGEGIRCRAGKCSFWITWEGNMMPCGMFPNNGRNNVFETAFDSCWERITEEADGIRLPVKCSGCKLKDSCRACAAMVITESGCFGKVPEYRCQMTQAYPVMRHKLREQLLIDCEEQPEAVGLGG